MTIFEFALLINAIAQFITAIAAFVGTVSATLRRLSEIWFSVAFGK